MRIVLCTETYLPVLNGVVTFLQMLSREWTAQGHEVLIVAPDHQAKKHYIQNGVLHCPAVKSERLLVDLSFPLNPVRLSLVKKFNPDIIHIQHEWGISMFGLRAAQQLKVPVVYTLHSEYSKYMTYAFNDFMIPWATSMLEKWERYIVKHATVVTSPSYKAQLYFDSIEAKVQVDVIQNSVELDDFDPERFPTEMKEELRGRLGITDEEKVALFVGRLGPEKSVDMLLDYWAKTVRPEDQLKLLLVGGGPDEQKLKEQAHQLGIGDRVIFAGRVPHAHIALYYAISDIYVSASLSEMHSVSMLEGLGSGLPVLQRLDEPNKDQLIEGVNGWFFETAEEFGSHLHRLCTLDVKERQRLRLQVRESVLETNSPRALADKYMAQYRKAIRIYRENPPQKEEREELA